MTVSELTASGMAATPASADDFAAKRVDRLGAAKLSQSHAVALKAKADGIPMPLATTAVTANGQRAVIYLPHALDRAVPVPLVIHFHGAGTNATTEVQWQPMWEAAQAAGFAVATCDFHGDAYGSPAVMADAQAVLDAVLTVAPINAVLLSGESMGGIAVLNALRQKALPNVLGAYLAQPVISLQHRYDNGRGGEIRAAYGIATDGSDYAIKTTGYDPNLEAGGSFGGVPIYITSSSNDAAALKTPFVDNFIARVRAHSPVTFVASTGGHGDPSHFIPSNYVAFLKGCAAGLVIPPMPSAAKTGPETVIPRSRYDFVVDSSLVCDFDASTLALADGAAVSTWEPARGTAKSPFSQATATNQPTYTASEVGINNKPSVAFGEDDFLDTGAWATSVSTPATVIAVARVNTAQAPNPFWTGRNGLYMYGGTTPAGIDIQTASNGGTVSKASAGSQWRIIVAVYEGSRSRLYVNTKTAVTGTTGTTAEGANAKLPGIKLNAFSGGTTGVGNTPRYARFAVVGSAITDPEAVDVIDSLAASYGITLSQ